MLAPCLHCGYPIVSSRGTRCSECGWIISDIEADTMRRRLWHLTKWEQRKHLMLPMSVMIGACCSLLWYTLFWANAVDWQPHASLLLAIATVPLAMHLIVRGSLCFAPDHQRPLLILAWYGAMPLMHAGWLCLIPLGVAMLMVILYGSLLEPGGSVQSVLFVLAGIGSILGWFLLSLTGAVSWFVAYNARCAKCWVHEQTKCVWIARILGLAGLLIYTSAGFLMGAELVQVLSGLARAISVS